MNRQQRRKKQKALPKYMRKTVEQRKAALYKNGITIKDLEKAEQEGYDRGYRCGVDATMNICYAATLRTTRELLRFGPLRNERFLRLMDHHVIHTIDSQEAVEAAYREAGLYITFDAVFDDERIQKVR